MNSLLFCFNTRLKCSFDREAAACRHDMLTLLQHASNVNNSITNPWLVYFSPAKEDIPLNIAQLRLAHKREAAISADPTLTD